MIRQSGIRTVLGALAICASFTGCPASRPPEPPPVAQTDTRSEDIVHKVQYNGETLALIAAWYTGKSSNWTIIREANPKLRPERINLGQIITVPGSIVIERRPLPKKFVQDSLAKVRPAVSTPPPSVSTGETVPETSPSTEKTTDVPVAGTTTAPSDEVNLDAILNDQIAAQKKAAQTAPPSVPDAPPSAPPSVPTANIPPTGAAPAPKNDKAPAAPGDSEREQLLDELLTQ